MSKVGKAVGKLKSPPMKKLEDKCAVVSFEVKTEYTPKTILINLPNLPIETLQQITSFLCWASSKHNCEALVSLTVDDQGQWVVIPWHQEARNALHVKFNMHSPENTEAYGHLFPMLEKVHCTIHSHNKTNAFQSPDDADDELQKNGWHMTIGKCNMTEKDFHLRYNFRKNAQFHDGVKIAEPIQQFIPIPVEMIVDIEVPEKYKDYADVIKKGELSRELEHPPEWESFLTKTNTYQTAAPYTGTNMGYQYSQESMALGNDSAVGGKGKEYFQPLVVLKKWDEATIKDLSP